MKYQCSLDTLVTVIIDCYRFKALLQNFHGFAARNIGMNKNGELAETKINLRLNQNKIKKIPGRKKN